MDGLKCWTNILLQTRRITKSSYEYFKKQPLSNPPVFVIEQNMEYAVKKTNKLHFNSSMIQSKFLGFTVLQTLGEFEENIRSAVAYIILAIEVDAVSNRQQSVL